MAGSPDEPTHKSFCLDTLNIRKPEDEEDHYLELHDTEPNSPADASLHGGGSGWLGTGPLLATGPNATCATLTLSIGKDQISQSRELGEVNEHPEALMAITSDLRLSTSGCIDSILPVVLPGLKSSLMTQVVAGMASVTLRSVANIPQADDTIPQEHGTCGEALQSLLKHVRDQLGLAIPFLKW